MSTLQGYYTATEAAKRLGYRTGDSIRHYCQQGKIAGAVKAGKMWFVPESWVLEQEKLPPHPMGNRGAARGADKK